MRFTLAIVAYLGVTLLVSCGGSGGQPVRTPPPFTPPSFLQQAADGIQTLQGEWYNQQTGLWNSTGWWNSANALTVVALYSKFAHSDQYAAVPTKTFALNSGGGFLNNYYDDEGWWALAWIASYDWTGDVDYLNAASRIFSDMTTGWDSVCGGGIWWNKNRNYKNAIANELFLSVAANLASRVTDSQAQAVDVSWAQKEWQWFAQSGMINSQSLINDGLNSGCKNNGQTTWTYNQGVILGGLSALAADTHDPSLLSAAQSIAFAAITRLTDSNGILHDPCEPNCSPDGLQFKGIFARNLATLAAANPSPEYVKFLKNNAQSIWANDQGPAFQFGLVWSGPFEFPSNGNAGIQTSAIDALLAAAEVTGGTS